LKELLELNVQVVPLNVDQYHQMIEAGILPEGEPIELLDGFLVRKDRSKAGGDPMTVGHHHAWAVAQLNDVLQAVKAHGCHVRIQQPLTVPPDHEPEPDAVIVRGTIHDYKLRHPMACDVTCVVEVADSSLRQDRTTKQRIYAEAGIGQYIIVNLIDRVVEEYRGPSRELDRYTDAQVHKKGDTVAFDVGNGVIVSVPASEFIP
jgi:Uma2 family endonuclease